MDIKHGNPEDYVYCPRYCDEAKVCFNTTVAGDVSYSQCPKQFHGVLLDHTENVSRPCLQNGTWDYADYRRCLILPMDTEMEKNVEINQTTNAILYTGSIISAIALLVAIFILAYFRCFPLLTRAIRIQLMVCFLMDYLIWLVLYHVLYELYVNAGYKSQNIYTWTCRLSITCANYLYCTLFFLMLVETVYYFHVLVKNCKIERLWKYTVLGWGFPVIPIAVWALVKVTKENNECWLESYALYDLILMVPIFISTIAIIILLVLIGCVMYRKRQILESKRNKNDLASRSSVKATLGLYPLLLFITIMSYILRPHLILWLPLLYSGYALYSIQGLILSLAYCFLNPEVWSALKNAKCRTGKKIIV